MKATAVVRLLVVSTLLITALPAIGAPPSSERDALLAFYNALGGDGWVDKSGWGGAAGTECSWVGVECDDSESTVDELILPSNNLTGELPSLAGLPNLRVIYLTDNHISGEIPPSYGQLTKLEAIAIAQNGLTGEIPQSLTGLSDLAYLELYSNQLTGQLPPGLGSLSNLRGIALYDNQLSGEIPAELGQLPLLDYLALAVNQFSGEIPATLGNLPNLEWLYLGGNQLSGSIPATLGSLPKLRTLSLVENQLTGQIPGTIGNLVTLEELDLCCNQLSGPIPAALGGLQNVLLVSLYNNELTGTIPPSLGSLAKLQQLHIDFNDLEGQLPSELGSLAELQILAIDANRLSGPIPDSFGNLGKLVYFSAWSNQLSGPIPASLGRATELRELYLSENLLSGPLPDLSALQNLEAFHVGNNPIGGEIPRWLGNLPNLRFLGMEITGVSGGIPAELSRLTHLQDLYLWDNELTGEFPQWIGNLSEMEAIVFGGNRLTGSLPATITSLRNLSYLDVQGNLLQGQLPADIGSLTELQYLSLGENLFSGDLPASMSQLRKLVDLRLDYNDFTGPLPSFAGFDELSVLLVHMNHVSGPFPIEMTSLPKLIVLGLGGNRFTGPLPPEIGNMTALENLDLSLNGFSGVVPPQITNLTNLRDHESDFNFNALRTSDPAVKAFLDLKTYNGDWQTTQTQPPTNVTVGEVTDRNVVLNWKPVPYPWDFGGYQITATPRGGGAEVVTMTPSKEEESFIVRGLSPSTTYDFRVRTVTHPDGFQQNLMVSEPANSVSATTTTAVVAPPDIAITTQPSGLVQIGGQPRNEDSYIVTNFGDLPTNLTTFLTEPHFFTVEPEAFTLAGGSSQVVRVRSIAGQVPGSYESYAVLEGSGVPEDGAVAVVRLLSVTVPAGTVIAEAVASRVEVAGTVGTDSVGAVSFRNTGTAPLTGMLVSDEEWIAVPSYVVTIQPNEIGALSFNVVRSKRPDAGAPGAITGTIRLIYVDSEGAAKLVDGITTHDAASGIGAATVTVVDTARPAVQAGQAPPLAAGEVAHFIAGVSSGAVDLGRAATDMSIVNNGGSQRIQDLQLYYMPIGGDATAASFPSLPTDNALNLANIVNTVYSSDALGTVQLRTSSWRNLQAFAASLFVRDDGIRAEPLPVIRSDRGVVARGVLHVTGLRQSASAQTKFYLQEVSGGTATAQIQFLGANGSAIGPTLSVSLTKPFGMVEAGPVPVGAVSAIVTSGEGSTGRIFAIATIREGLHQWTVFDSARLNDFAEKEAVRIVSAAADGDAGRKRPVRRHDGGANAAATAGTRTSTSLTIFNTATTSSVGTLTFHDSTGSATQKTLTFAARETRQLDDVVRSIFGRGGAHGQITFRPEQGTFVVFAQMKSTTAGGVENVATIPIVGFSKGVRSGQRQLFTSIDQALPEAAAEGTPATSSVRLEIVETGGASVKVRVKLTLADARSLAGTTFTKNYDIEAGRTLRLDDLASAIIGDQRASYGNIHNAKLQIEPIAGNGAALAILSTIDNGSGDSYMRLD